MSTVLKCTWVFFFFFSGRVRPTEQESTVIEKVVGYGIQEKGLSMPHGPTWGSTRGNQEAEQRRKPLSTTFCGEAWTRQGKQLNGFRIG